MTCLTRRKFSVPPSMPGRSIKSTVEHLRRVYGEARLPPSEGVPFTSGHRRLLEAILKPSIRQRRRKQVVTLRAEGKTTEQIGQTLEISARAVRGRVNRPQVPIQLMSSPEGFAYACRPGRRWLPVVVCQFVCGPHCGRQTYGLFCDDGSVIGLQGKGYCQSCSANRLAPRQTFTVTDERHARADDVQRWLGLSKQQRLTMRPTWRKYFDL